MKLLHREAFRHSKLLHGEVFTHSKFLHTASFYTQKLLHKEAFTRRSFYTEKALHSKLLHTEAFHKERFLHRNTEKLLNTAIATWVQQCQYDLLCPAARHNSMTHAAVAPRNFDVAITIRWTGENQWTCCDWEDNHQTFRFKGIGVPLVPPTKMGDLSCSKQLLRLTQFGLVSGYTFSECIWRMRGCDKSNITNITI